MFGKVLKFCFINNTRYVMNIAFDKLVNNKRKYFNMKQNLLPGSSSVRRSIKFLGG